MSGMTQDEWEEHQQFTRDGVQENISESLDDIKQILNEMSSVFKDMSEVILKLTATIVKERTEQGDK